MSKAELTGLTLAEARDGLVAKDFSAVELAEAHVDAVEQIRSLNAYLVETPDAALEGAKLSDERISKGEARPLEGLPLGIKDLFCTKGVQAAAGSKILEGFKPPYESTVTSQLWRDGALMLGKLNMDEFAMGSANITSAFGPVESPWKRPGENRPLVPGGSSGGSAAAVSARAALAATGTDTGGSIRQPAAFTGIVGLKPTYGRCSRWGIIAFASSLDQAGPMTRTVRDAAIMMRSMAGYDPKDSTSVNTPVPNYEKALTGDIRGLKVGIPKQYRVDGMDAEIEAMWDQGVEWLKAAGAEAVEVDLPHTSYALPTYYIVAPAECSSNLARYDGVRYGLRVEGEDLNDMYARSRAAGFGDEVKRRILIGTYVLSAGYYDAYYIKAQKVRALIAEDFRKAFEQVDVLLTPTAPSAAFAVGENSDDPVAMYLNDVFTVPASLAGLPGMSLPATVNKDGLPLGLQLIGRPFDEETVIRVGGVMEEAAAFSAKPNGLIAA
ncbi:MAG: Asp-tRNA(Asn)/Glu-tRNA(Gln) amidotransferase GatCAB subunit A [Alphaproteobacteria bacterium]|nr:Asp-tRNA(Asn)/Glu-tRNA(Gln) amidotransferase GatCAB subunit A [Alphaproteobacteria bacterium]MAS49183.1 Asp-tRNA(Asn)/Glu-tRNA(Gln) amidotransferase GatCAB subunit A [Alphaproteobacteria bacterium]MAX97215.1 Asp-tRNA(Asn)/Glu-tRNA(Gln) amidotransferase GatCAB subunit A [Alphaproteobacteria bacterium]MBN52429.1 Asp-tRNA(Asn)/Glu-tRNA(Gln) amidotransferase GatCAB subunit A [Alphaproteobacteria bacterium]OUT39776.1 MAG: aspartyl/glutamyl-tRNA amidotransferase subunit A [Micavibrio sp. TMED2]|tara:strand:- start:3422 stop:4906 length:1485 start_codon:yes stop_codon:yes gene_type:complete